MVTRNILKEKGNRRLSALGSGYFRYTITGSKIRRVRLRPGELNGSLRDAPHENQDHLDTFHGEHGDEQFPGLGKTAAEGEAALGSL